MSRSTTSSPSEGATAIPGRRQRATFHPLPVAAVDRLTDDAVAITLDVPPELRDVFAFEPGQHVALTCDAVGDDVRRNYSICSAAGSGALRVAVKRIPDGAFSSHAAAALSPGDTLRVLPPAGRFVARPDPGQAQHYGAIAAGSGITPLLSIITSVLEVEPGSRCTLIYANRATRSIMFLEELQDLKNRFPDRFTMYHVLSREPRTIDLFSGRLDGAKLSAFLDALIPPETVDHWYLCGPLPMVEELRPVLVARGADPRRVHRELFHTDAVAVTRSRPAEASGAGETSAVRIVLDGRETTVEVERHGEPILDAVLRVREDAPYACRGGVCGTCRARLLDGEVEMDQNYALEEDEREAGFVLACQSHPRSERVTLDFDN